MGGMGVSGGMWDIWDIAILQMSGGVGLGLG